MKLCQNNGSQALLGRSKQYVATYYGYALETLTFNWPADFCK